MWQEGHAEYHLRREAQELKRAWAAPSEQVRRIHLALANQHRLRGIGFLLGRD